MIIRIVKLLILIISILSALTGIRIWLFNESILPNIALSWIDTIQLGGNIFNQHLILGFALLGLVILLAAFGSWQFIRKRDVKVAGKPSWVLKKSILFAIYTLLGASILSGLFTYSGHVNDLILYATVNNVHTYSFYGLAGLGLFYLILLFVFRKDQIGSDYKTTGSVWATAAVLLTSLGISVLGVYSVFKYLERPVTIISKNIYRSPIIDGRTSGIEWVGADSLSVIASGGDNFPNEMTQVKMKSFHNFQYIFFLFQWADPEPSFNRSVIKTDSGWIELKSEFSPFGESVYFEDQLAISFHKSNSGCAQSCHLGNSIRAGSHYTQGDTADLWVWKAVSTNPASEGDDGWWGAKLNDSVGGRHFDNSPGGGYISNLNEEWDEPYFLPGHHAFDNWIWTQSDKYLPYRASLDNYQIGATLPGMLVSRFTGDRSDLYAKGEWRNGVWTLELSRRINTGSPFDAVLRNEVTIGLAVFNNSEIKHAYHIISVIFVVED